MPPKTPRPPGVDEWVAARVRYEREQRGWSTSELARRVSLAGVTLRQQQVWQIESGKPPRKLSVGEAAAFAKIFDISLAELMTPPPSEETADVMGIIEIGRMFMEWQRDAGVLAARFLDIGRRVDVLGEESVYTADNVVKFSADNLVPSEQIIRNLEAIAGDYQAIAERIKDRSSIWSLLASMKDMIAVTEPEPDEPDGAH